MSRQDILTLRLTLSALFLTFLIIASLLANIVSVPRGSPTLHSQPVQQHHDDDPHQDGGMLDALAEMAAKSFSESWAYYSPYHPAAPFEGSMRQGCVVSQVNIVSRHAVPGGTPPLPTPIPAPTPRRPLSHLWCDKDDHRRARKASGCHKLQRYQA